MQLSSNFTLDELTSSATGKRLKIDNTPDAKVLQELVKLAQTVLQPLRNAMGESIIVTSGYRCPSLNKAVGGVSTSQHKYGQAADLKCSDNRKLYDTAKRLMKEGKITVGQLIWEYGTTSKPSWVHISTPTSKLKNQLVFIGVDKNKIK